MDRSNPLVPLFGMILAASTCGPLWLWPILRHALVCFPQNTKSSVKSKTRPLRGQLQGVVEGPHWNAMEQRMCQKERLQTLSWYRAVRLNACRAIGGKAEENTYLWEIKFHLLVWVYIPKCRSMGKRSKKQSSLETGFMVLSRGSDSSSWREHLPTYLLWRLFCGKTCSSCGMLCSAF